MKEEIFDAKSTHETYHKFYAWLQKAFGKDLYGEWQHTEGTNQENGKKFKFKHRHYDEHELSKRLVGHKVIEKIEKRVNKYHPEIKIVYCDDQVYAGP